MFTIELKSGRVFWVDEIKREGGKYLFVYIRKDGTVEKHETDEDAVLDVVETEGTVKNYFKAKKETEE
jgi:hypothetical protein